MLDEFPVGSIVGMLMLAIALVAIVKVTALAARIALIIIAVGGLLLLAWPVMSMASG